jgi:hypothetical protein
MAKMYISHDALDKRQEAVTAQRNGISERTVLQLLLSGGQMSTNLNCEVRMNLQSPYMLIERYSIFTNLHFLILLGLKELHKRGRESSTSRFSEILQIRISWEWRLTKHYISITTEGRYEIML